MRASITPVDEVPWVLDANRERIAAGTASPGLENALAAGLLLAGGHVRRRSDLLAQSTGRLESGVIHLEARIDPGTLAAALVEQRHCVENGCGLLHFTVCDPTPLQLPRSAPPPEASALAEPLRSLFDRCEMDRPDGGVHAAAIMGPAGIESMAVDVGRHSAVYKSIGAAFLAGASLQDRGLVLTARISGLIALSAARSGIAWVASRSIPTTLAVAIASVARMPLLARVGGRRAMLVPLTGAQGGP